MTRLLPLFALTALTAAACQKESKPTDPATPTTAPTSVPEVVEVPEVAEVAIASVTMLEDCPEPAKVEAATVEAATEGERRPEPKRAEGATADVAEGDSAYGYVEPCGQSTMQIAVTGQGDVSSTLKVVEVRLLGPDEAILGIIAARSPTIWKNNGYGPWDQVVQPKTDVKASYKLSLDNWGKIEKTLGQSSYGPMFLIEADIDIGGVRKTIRSSQAAREPMEMIET
jgi:hypothetical protein